MSNAGFWQVNPSPCLPGCSTAPGRGIFHQLPTMGSLQYKFDIMLQDSFGLFKPTLIVLKSFPPLLAGAPDGLCTAAPKDNTTDTDQLLLEEVFLDQLCWCSPTSGSMKQVSAAERGYFWDDLQWLQNFKDDKWSFVGFSEEIVIKGFWISNSASEGFSMLRHRWRTVLAGLVSLTEPKTPPANSTARPLCSLIGWNVNLQLCFKE